MRTNFYNLNLWNLIMDFTSKILPLLSSLINLKLSKYYELVIVKSIKSLGNFSYEQFYASSLNIDEIFLL